VRWENTKGKITAAGELLWLWKADVQTGQEWEVFLSFNQRDKFETWRIGTYRTLLTVSDVI